MHIDPNFQRLLRAEQDADAQRAALHVREARRHGGVAWSGLAPDPLAGRSPADLSRDAEARLADLRVWRQGATGRLLSALTDAERAVEGLRSCLARGLALQDARCGLALEALHRAADAARSAMDATDPVVLSDGPCATNTASSNPSTASSRNSAS
ncbi:MAG TPA: hypothetical protein VFE18_11920 [Phenylobacterium sp.]|jgi:hypothetical protein|uniref:hypothetical protein n=1 Tax=Phenylobacterium sp. TaxID=1871053 RepID=UPI002D2A3481|nr:hypothetical protein [Phenylobacterium sp.]HZZ68869.1 hypothetical protein [Phenylobacterium sp.]